MRLLFFHVLAALVGTSSVQALAVAPANSRAVYNIVNWETGLFMDRRPGNEEYGYPAIGLPYDLVEDRWQKWTYNFNGTVDGATLFYIGGSPGDTVDVQFVNTDDGETVTLEYSPALFELRLLTHVQRGPAYILKVADADLAITARREHSTPLKLRKVDPNDPLQHWRFYVPTFN